MLEERYKVVIAFDDLEPRLTSKDASEIQAEFLTSRPWHQNVICTVDERSLFLQAENDYDPKGLALSDELSDVVTACCDGGYGGTFRLVSSEIISNDDIDRRQ